MSGPAPASIPVAAVVMTRDEAANIAACLETLAPFSSRIVVDSASADGTPAIAVARGARVVPFAWNGAYPKKKQWCLEWLDLSEDWVLFVDADERVTPALAAELAALFRAGPAAAAYFVDSRPVVLGQALRFGPRYRKIALMHRRRVRFPPCPDLGIATMWEVEGHYQPVVDGPVGRLAAPLLHADAKPPFAWFARHNRYFDWEATLDVQGGRAETQTADAPGRRLLKRLFVRLPARPLAVLAHDLVLRLGLLDGMPGLHHAVARAFYYWQIDYKRAWLRRRP